MSYPNLPNEILNMIFSYVGPSPIVEILKPEINKYLTSNHCILLKKSFNERILENNLFYRLDKYYYNTDDIRDYEEGKKLYNQWLERKLPSENRLIPRILYNSLDNDVLQLIKYKRNPHPNAEIMNNKIEELSKHEEYAYKYIKNSKGVEKYKRYRLKTFCEKRLRTDYVSENDHDNPLMKIKFFEKCKFKRYYKEVILGIKPKLSHASQQQDSDSDSDSDSDYDNF
jgi:hypothetical protein